MSSTTTKTEHTKENKYKQNISKIHKENLQDYTRYMPKRENKLKFRAHHKNIMCLRPLRTRKSVYAKSLHKITKIVLNLNKFIKKLNK